MSSSLSIVFDDGQRIAVIVNGIIGTISTLSVSLLLLHLLTVSFVSGRANANKDERIFLRMHLGIFVVCLLFSDLIQGSSGIIQLVWASRRGIDAGPLCTAQAAMLLFGDLGTAFWNAVVAIHTFWTVVLGKRMSTVAVAFLVATGWTMCVILAIIGPLAIQSEANGPFYAVAGAWCFVTNEYKDVRIYIHYLPMLTSAFIITVLYVLVALVLFGILVVDGNKWHFKAPARHSINGVRDFFGQFSWGRLHRPSGPSGPKNMHLMSQSSGGIKSVNARPPYGSIRLGGVLPRNSDVKAPLEGPDGPSTTVTVQTIDISPRPDTGSTANSMERGRKSTAKTIANHGENKQPAVQNQISVAKQVSGKALQLKTLAIKMLWYPIVYLILIMPIAVSRVDSNVTVSLSVMLGFMCLLWLMGTANTVIYVCTRRLGPTPWAGRKLSLSRNRSKSGRAQEATTLSHHTVLPVIPVQIYVDRTTQRATDEQFIEIAREKSVASSLNGADISALTAMPSVAHRHSRENAVPDYRDSKVGFDLGGANAPHHVLRQGSLSGPHTSDPFELPPRRSLQYQQEPSTYTYTLPRPLPPQPQQPQQHQELSYQEPHPYAHARSPTGNSRTSHEGHAPFPPYYYEDDDDSLRTQSRTHSRKGSDSRGVGTGF